MDEREFAKSLRMALGEPPQLAETLYRLERRLYEPSRRPAGSERDHDHPRGMALVAACLTLLVLGSLLVTQTLRHRQVAPPARSAQPAASPAAPSPPAGPHSSAAPQRDLQAAGLSNVADQVVATDQTSNFNGHTAQLFAVYADAIRAVFFVRGLPAGMPQI